MTLPGQSEQLHLALNGGAQRQIQHLFPQLGHYCFRPLIADGRSTRSFHPHAPPCTCKIRFDHRRQVISRTIKRQHYPREGTSALHNICSFLNRRTTSMRFGTALEQHNAILTFQARALAHRKRLVPPRPDAVGLARRIHHKHPERVARDTDLGNEPSRIHVQKDKLFLELYS